MRRRGRRRRRNPFAITRSNPKIMGLPPILVYGAVGYAAYKKLYKKEPVFPGGKPF